MPTTETSRYVTLKTEECGCRFVRETTTFSGETYVEDRWIQCSDHW